MVVYTAYFVDVEKTAQRFGQLHPNLFSHHSTIEFKPSGLDGLQVGSASSLRITGRLTTDRVDVLLVDNPLSKNEHPHITLSTAEGVKPFESNQEIKNNLSLVEPMDVEIAGVLGYLDSELGALITQP